MTTTRTVFRLSIWKTFLTAAVLAFLISYPAAWLIGTLFFDGPLLVPVRALLEAGVIGLLLSAGGALYFRYEVFEEGVLGYSFFGRRHEIRWEQIRSARSRFFFPFGAIEVRSTDAAIVLPWNLARASRYRQAVIELGPQGNPLRAFFDDRRDSPRSRR